MKQVAAIVANYAFPSYGQQIADRFLAGYPHNGKWRRPAIEIVSLCAGRKPAGDLSAERAREFGFQVYPSIAEALRRGRDRLAVDGVLVIGEATGPDAVHGFFQQCVEVFEKDGRAAPVYAGPRLSAAFAEAKSMVDAARRLRFPMLAGSPLPLTWRLPDVELPLHCEIEAALMVGAATPEAADYEVLEALQCMVERRKGGETGVRAVQSLEGDAVWRAGEEGRWSKELLIAALSRSDSPQGWSITDGRTQDLVGNHELPKLVKNPVACLIEYRSGLRAALLMLDGAVKDLTFAARVKTTKSVVSTQFFLGPPPDRSHFACLAAKIDELVETGRAPYPVERALLVSGLVESCLESRRQGQRRISTPQLAVRYSAPAQSQYCRA